MARDLSGAVVVLTGASSGIGRAAALSFARCGSRLVLAARSPEPLEAVAAECGNGALAVVTDVRDEAAVRALAERAVERFGRLDVWVNSAGVIAYGRFEDVPSDVFRAVIETRCCRSSSSACASAPSGPAPSAWSSAAPCSYRIAARSSALTPHDRTVC
jgi:NAD(P)-dependent dehydrogenase (short-subunit alcohol dehydrogenase family)